LSVVDIHLCCFGTDAGDEAELTSDRHTKREKVVDAGPVHISADRQKTVTWPPYAGGILIIAGVVMLVTARGRR